MRIRSLLSMLILSTASLAQQPAPAAPAATPPSADAICRRVIENMAGPAWDKARYFAFTFDVVRADGAVGASFAQRWDRYTGQYRVTGRDPQKNDFTVVMNTNTKQGHAWKNGIEVTEPSTFDLGYRRFINDTYWLLMPLKSMDPGVHREYAGERTDSCGHTWDVVKLSFDAGVGLTSGDQYWMWVNRDTGLVEEWDMRLQSMKPDEPLLEVMFRDYRRIGDILISTRREIRGKGQTIRLDDLVISSDVPPGAFEK
jgi:hypothetical protein